MENSHIPNDLLDLTKTIPAKYFLRDDFDQTRFWLESLPGNYERDFYDVELSVYKKGLTAVDSSSLMIVDGICKVQEIKADLLETSLLCQNGRKDLENTKGNVILGGLDIVAKHRKREALVKLYFYLGKMLEMKRKEKKFEDAVSGYQFDEAVGILKSYEEMIAKFPTISLIAEKQSHVDLRYESFERMLEKELKLCCGEYNPERYAQAIRGSLKYKQVKVDQVIEGYYENYIYQLLRQTVIAFVPKYQMQQNETTLNFETICKSVPAGELTNVVFNALYSLSIVIFNFYKIYSFNTDEVGYAEIKWFLSHYRKVLWESIMLKTCAMLSAIPLTMECKLKDFISIYHASLLFCEFGEEFSESDSIIMRNTLNSKCKEYFRFYNRRNLEELRMILENETFAKLEGQTYEDIAIPDYEASRLEMISTVRGSFKTGENPFKALCYARKIEFDDVNKKTVPLSQKNGVSNENSTPTSSPMIGTLVSDKPPQLVFTLTSIKLIQKFVDFVSGMILLPPISEEFAFGMRNLYFYYVFTIFTVFGNVFPVNQEMDSTVKDSLRGVYKNYIELLRGKPVEANLFFIFVKSNVMDFARLNLAERVTAIESLSTFTCLQPFFDRLEDFIPKNRGVWWSNLTSEMEVVNKEVRRRVCSKTIPQIFNVSYLLTDIPKENWEIPKDSGVITQTSKFVNQVMKDYDTYLLHIKVIQDITSDKLWEKFLTVPIAMIIDGHIEGYSRILKCNRSGRDLMKYNYSCLEDFFKKSTQMDQIPKARMLLEYINGYYYPQEAIWSWVEENYSKFTKNQMINLLKVMNLTNLKELQTKIEKLEYKTDVKTPLTSPKQEGSPQVTNHRTSMWDLKSLWKK